MEWWENDNYEQVDEISKELATRAWNKRMMQAAIPFNNPYKKQNINAQMRTGIAYGKRVDQGHMIKTGVASSAARAAATGALAYGAYKGGKALYNKVKNRNKGEEGDAKAANEGWSWYDDPGAMSIMESYFDEFADADMQ